MNLSNCQLRRATLEDLDDLRRLWERAARPTADLEKRFTEFQVARAADGILLGCLGLQIAGPDGQIHGEAYASSEVSGPVRELLWSRVQSVARNHGLYRLWIREPGDFWRAGGFQAVAPEALQKLPAAFGAQGPRWSSLKLRDEPAKAISVEQEFELFKESQRQWSESALRQARVLRVLAGIIAAGTLLVAIWTVWYVLRRLPPPGRR